MPSVSEFPASAIWGISRWRAQKAALLLEQTQDKVNIKSLSAELCVSRRQLERDFRRTFGVSPMEYRRRLQLEKAIVALKAGTAIVQIAASFGYVDQSHFTHVTRRLAGTTPGALKREFKADNRAVPS